MKKVIKLDVYYYNHERYHESLSNTNPADMYYGRTNKIIKQDKKLNN